MLHRKKQHDMAGRVYVAFHPGANTNDVATNCARTRGAHVQVDAAEITRERASAGTLQLGVDTKTVHGRGTDTSRDAGFDLPTDHLARGRHGLIRDRGEADP